MSCHVLNNFGLSFSVCYFHFFDHKNTENKEITYRITPHARPLAWMRVLSNFGIFEKVKTFQYMPIGKKIRIKIHLARR